ncbi:hypothetical protein J1C56_02490 [Aminobacter anthyllidis]|uniref:Uncharacterized protein n=1 Tax=Aminobacter anthyllidis TaxID=1035067 RepID=A0A9X1A774_9HYPH|nr:hypothetical protein [Aminobacter anthyllidis]MBT1154453.1 hypothetical protein [Aminobacter anthyllidis]
MDYKEEMRLHYYREAVTAFPEAGPWGVKVTLRWGPMDLWEPDDDSRLEAVFYEFTVHGKRLRISRRYNMRLVDAVKQGLMGLLYPRPV